MKWQSVFVVLLIIGIAVAVSIGESYAPQRNPYSFKSREDTGSLAFYLLLQKYTTVERVETSLKDLESGTLLMIGPARPPSDTEMGYLFIWVRQGNRVIVFSDDPQVMKAFGATVSAGQKRSVVIPPFKDHRSTQNVEAVALVYYQYFTTYTGDVLFADGDNPVIIVMSKGKGEIFLVSDTSIVWNINVNDADNEIFLVQASLSDTVYFDEYHLYHLKKEKGISLKSFGTLFSGYRPFFVQFMITLALFLVAYGKRFGVARPVAPQEVQSSELVVSAAELYYKAKKEEVLKVIDNTKYKSHLQNER
ncbi:MAG: DUF4350 domain-containing protein [Theionarchaea archaeon]|nr:DUF4350 domain-containing protein [Theionarchaea archaeon]